MIAYVEGALLSKEPERVVIKAGGVGYELHVSGRTVAALPEEGAEVELWVHTVWSQDDMRLFGFRDRSEQAVFLELIQIAGVGPKLAMGVLSQLDTPDLIHAVVTEDLAVLKTLKGIGKKTAERFILELSGKPSFTAIDAGSPTPIPGTARQDEGLLQELRGALTNLGYRRKEIDAVVARLKESGELPETIEDAVLRALALLGG